MHSRQKVKSAIYPFLTILLAAAFIVLSMACVRTFLKRRETALLNSSGRIEQTAPVSAALEKEDGEKITLSIDEIEAVVRTWNRRSSMSVHEPVEGQISMNEAVKAVDEWLPKMGFSEGILSGNSTVRSSLNVAKVKGEKTEILSPDYSFWEVAVNGDKLEGIFYVNAVTGQIWEAVVTLPDEVEELSDSRLLDTFTRLAGFTPKEQENETADSNSSSTVAEAYGYDSALESWDTSVGITGSNMKANIICVRYPRYYQDVTTEYDESIQKTIEDNPYITMNFTLSVE